MIDMISLAYAVSTDIGPTPKRAYLATRPESPSALASSLERHLWKNIPSLEIYSISWPARFSGLHRGSNYRSLLNCATDKPVDARIDWLGLEHTLLIIDEAQRSYEYDSLWSDFLRIQADSRQGGILVILFSSFGSPSETPLQISGSAPIHFSPEQRVSIRPPEWASIKITKITLRIND
jgi:hypothetical protein